MPNFNASERYLISIAPHLPVCVNCRYFHRHYLVDGSPLECGHCTEPRLKYRNTYDYCDKFERRNNNE